MLQSKNPAALVGVYMLLVISTGLGAISLGQAGGGNVRLWQALLAVFVLLLFFKICLKKRIVLMVSLPLLFVVGYFMAVFISGINAIDAVAWQQRVALVLAMSLLFFVFSQRSTLAEFGLFLKLVVSSGVFFSLLAILDIYLYVSAPDLFQMLHQFDGGRTFVDESGFDLRSYNLIARARGFFAEPNEFSQYLILPFGFLLAAIFFQRQRSRRMAIYLIGILVVFFAQLFSLSRGGLLGFFGVFIGLVLVRKVSGIQLTLHIKNRIKTIIVLSALTIVAGLYYSEDITPLINTVADRVVSTGSGDDWTADLRLMTIEKGLASSGSIVSNFLVGVGAGNLSYSLVQEATTTNQLVDVLVETGIIGLTFYVAIILSLLWLSYKFMKNRSLTSNNELFVVFAGSYLSLIGMLFGGMTYATHALFFFWLNAGLLLAICKYGTKINKQEIAMQEL